MDQSTGAVLGLPGFGLEEVRETDCEFEYLAEANETVAGGPACGTNSGAEDRRDAVLRDFTPGIVVRTSRTTTRTPRPHSRPQSRPPAWCTGDVAGIA